MRLRFKACPRCKDTIYLEEEGALFRPLYCWVCIVCGWRVYVDQLPSNHPLRRVALGD